MSALRMALTLWCLGAGGAAAQTMLTTGALVSACTLQERDWVGFCNGYIHAATDLVVLNGDACLPAGTPRSTIFDALLTALVPITQRDPQVLDQSALIVVPAVLTRLFPCD